MQPIDLSQLSDKIEQRDGIWFAKTQSAVSFPESDYDICYQIEDNSFWFKHRNNCLLETVKQFPPEGIFYDVGGGNGFVTLGLQKAGVDAVLVEPGLSGVNNARKRGISNVICATLENAGFNAASLPAIGVFDVVEHIEDDKAFVQEMYKCLKPGGRIYISVPAFKFLWSEEDDHAGHYRRYTTGEMRKLLQSCGFEVEYTTYIFSILPIPVFLFRTLPTWLGFKRKSEELQTHADEHAERKGLISRMLDKVWNFELGRISRKKSIFMGGSVLAVGRKIN